MNKPTDILAYIISHTGRALSLKTALHALYLVDWKSAIDSSNHHTLTSVNWIKKNEEPYTDKISEIINDKNFEIRRGSILNEWLVALSHDYLAKVFIAIDHKDKQALDFVVEKLKTRSLDELNNLIASTLPMIAKTEDNKLKIEELAKYYTESVKPIIKSNELSEAV